MPGGRARSTTLAINADLAPTILDAAGAERRAGRGRRARCCPSPSTRSAARTRAADRAVRRRRPMRTGQAGITYSAVRTSRYKYVAQRHRRGRALRPAQPTPTRWQNLAGDPAYDEVRGGAGLAARRRCGDCSGAGLSHEAVPEAEAAALGAPRRALVPARRGVRGRRCAEPGPSRGQGDLPRWLQALRARDRTRRSTKRILKPRLLRKQAPAGDPRDRRADRRPRSVSLQKRVRICR